jgi:sugar-specific transcriptional regulator TrmB
VNYSQSTSYLEDTAVLIELGLTLSEARIFLALVQIGSSHSGPLSKVTGIHRQHIYNALDSLVNKGLIEKQLGTVPTYKAISVEEALSVLVKRKQKQVSEIEIKAKKLAENFKKNKGHEIEELKGDSKQFVVASGKEAINALGVKRGLETAQISTDIITTQKFFCGGIENFAKEFKEVSKRGVKIRILMDDGTPARITSKKMPSLMKNANFTIRYLSTPPGTAIAIFDKKEVNILGSATGNLADTCVLWSNSNCLLAVLQDYFENLWRNSIS